MNHALFRLDTPLATVPLEWRPSYSNRRSESRILRTSDHRASNAFSALSSGHYPVADHDKEPSSALAIIENTFCRLERSRGSRKDEVVKGVRRLCGANLSDPVARILLQRPGHIYASQQVERRILS